MASAVDDLSMVPGIEFQPSVRGAAILLVAGTPRPGDLPALRRLHDQLPHPRATVWWRAEPAPGFGARHVVAADDPEPVLVATHHALLRGERESEPDILPDEPPSEWRGVGPHGQGGEGMMGGTPYGRPMPMMGEEIRDGLMLDAYTACFGPFLPVLPAGLAVELTLQGDVIQKAAVRQPPYDDRPDGQADAFRLAARLLDLLGLAPHATGLRRAARESLDVGGAGRLLRLIRLSAAMRAIPPGLGSLPEGSVREACGGIDVRARLRRWLDGDAGRPPPGELGVRLADLLPGLEWSEAMLVVNSFESPALAAMCPIDAGDGEKGETGGGHGGHRGYGGHGGLGGKHRRYDQDRAP